MIRRPLVVVTVDHLERDDVAGGAQLRRQTLDVDRWCSAVATTVHEGDRSSDLGEVRGESVLDDDVSEGAAVGRPGVVFAVRCDLAKDVPYEQRRQRHGDGPHPAHRLAERGQPGGPRR